LALPTVWLLAKMSFADMFFYRMPATVRLSANNSLPTAGKGCRQKTFFADCPYYGCQLNYGQLAKMPSPVVAGPFSAQAATDATAREKEMRQLGSIGMNSRRVLFSVHGPSRLSRVKRATNM
jgi:hypothetical protein